MRFFAADGKELLSRTDGVYASDALAERLVAALAAARRPLPGYLKLAREELAREPLERAVFSMACFWRGEGVLGSIPGVRSTRAGWLDGHEVVDLEYAPEHIAFSELLQLARTEGCAERVWVEPGARLDQARALLGREAHELAGAPRRAKESDHEYYLRASACAALPLTPLQRVRVNARLGDGREVEDLLSPGQRTLLARIEARRERVAGMRPPDEVGALWRYRLELESRLADQEPGGRSGR